MTPTAWILSSIVLFLLIQTSGETRLLQDWIPPLLWAGLLTIPALHIVLWLEPHVNQAFGHDQPTFRDWETICHTQAHRQWVRWVDARSYLQDGDICTAHNRYWQIYSDGRWREVEYVNGKWYEAQ